MQLPDAAQPGPLTDALRRAGILGDDAEVQAVAIESSRATILSRITRLRIEYEAPSESAPKFVILKTGLSERAGRGLEAGRHEIAFYEGIASTTSNLPVPRCFSADANERTDQWHLILEDLTDSHFTVAPWPLPPTAEQCERIIDARARFHAALWDDPRLGISIGNWLDDAGIDQFFQRLATEVARFTERLGDRLSDERRSVYDRLLDAGPRLFARYHARANLTVVQGDAHAWNCFLARDGGDDTRFFDWDAWRIGTGASDLAHMMTVQWYPDQRRRMERHLLDRYYAALLALGVQGFDRKALDDDYRLSTLFQTTWPVWQAAYDIPPVIWWNNLERVMMAVDDLGCRDLLC
jgi:hypothetical protein